MELNKIQPVEIAIEGKVIYQKNENGTIISSGKFEGENQETVDFWEYALNGLADEEITDIDGTQYSIFKISDDSNVIIYCDSNGFVYKSFLSKKEKNKLLNEITKAHLQM